MTSHKERLSKARKKLILSMAIKYQIRKNLLEKTNPNKRKVNEKRIYKKR